MNLLKIVPLKTDSENLKRIFIGLGTIPMDEIDIDLGLICMDESGHNLQDIFYLNKSLGDSISFLEDNDYFMKNNLTDKDVDVYDVIEIHLDKIPDDIQSMKVIICLYNGHERQQDLSTGKYNIFLANPDNNQKFLEYELEGNFKNKTGIFVANIYRNNGCWVFKPIGEGVDTNDIKEMFLMNEPYFHELINWKQEMMESMKKRPFTNWLQKIFCGK